jgi:hypothetical protein
MLFIFPEGRRGRQGGGLLTSSEDGDTQFCEDGVKSVKGTRALLPPRPQVSPLNDMCM